MKLFSILFSNNILTIKKEKNTYELFVCCQGKFHLVILLLKFYQKSQKFPPNELTLISQTDGRSIDNLGISQGCDTMKSYLENVIDPSVLKRQRYEEAKRKHEILLNRIAFLDLELKPEDRRYKYNYEGIMPFLFFFKFLARKPHGNESTINRLKLWIPDSIILNERGELPPMWFYSSNEGFVYRTDNFNAKQIINKLSNYSSTDELVAILKKVNNKKKNKTYKLFFKPCYKMGQELLVGNDIKLLSTKELNMITTSIFQAHGGINIYFSYFI